MKVRAATPAAILCAYSLVTLAFTWPIATQLGTHLAGGSSDCWLLFWNLWWFRESLFYEPSWPFYTHMLLHPEGLSLALSPPTLINTLPGAVLGLLLPLAVVYNLLVLGNLVLAAAAMHLLALRVVRAHHAPAPLDHGVAAFAGLAFALSPFHLSHLSHLNIFTIWVLPTVAWSVLRFADMPRPRRAALVGAALGACGLADAYILVQGLMLAALVWFMSRQPRSPRPTLRALATLGGTLALVLIPLIVPVVQYGASALNEVRSAGGANEYVADLLSYTLPSPMHPIWGDAASRLYAPFSGNLAESVVFPTYTVLALAFVAWRRQARGASRWGAVAAVFVLLSLGPYLHVAGRDVFVADWGPSETIRLPLPKLLLDQLPILSGARAAGRFAATGQLGLVVVAALGLTSLVRPRTLSGDDAPQPLGGAAERPRGSRRQTIAATVLVGVVLATLLAECWVAPLPSAEAHVPEAYRILRREVQRTGTGGVLLEIPTVHRDDKIYEFYQSVHGLRILSGRFARGRRSAYDKLYRDPFLSRLRDPRPLTQPDGLLSLAGLDSLGVEYVMVHQQYDSRATSIVRVLEREFERIATPPGEPHLMRRRRPTPGS